MSEQPLKSKGFCCASCGKIQFAGEMWKAKPGKVYCGECHDEALSSLTMAESVLHDLLARIIELGEKTRDSGVDFLFSDYLDAMNALCDDGLRGIGGAIGKIMEKKSEEKV